MLREILGCALAWRNCRRTCEALVGAGRRRFGLGDTVAGFGKNLSGLIDVQLVGVRLMQKCERIGQDSLTLNWFGQIVAGFGKDLSELFDAERNWKFQGVPDEVRRCSARLDRLLGVLGGGECATLARARPSFCPRS